MMKTISSGAILRYTCIAIVAIAFSSCFTSRVAFHPEGKYPPEKLKKDYKLFQNILEESHPSLYWFISKDSLDYYFEQGYNNIRDSMTERQFRTLMTYVVTKIRCGHTSIRYSKKYSRYLDTADLKVFPLSLKFCTDTIVVTGRLKRRDSLLSRGTVITSVNGYTPVQLRDTFFHYVTGDGFSVTGRYQALSNRGNFGVLYKNVFGLPDTFHLKYLDTSGFQRETSVAVFDPKKDSVDLFADTGTISRRKRKERAAFAARNLQVDLELKSAYMTVNTFSRGNALRGFFRRSFKVIKKHDLKHLVVDVRGNGGGDAGNSTLLTQYLVDRPFKIADSLYAIKRKSHYRNYIKWQPLYWFMMTIVTRKRSDGKYHFGYFERHYFKRKRKYHFDGNIYIITGGNSFSATTLFAQTLKGQQNVKIVGEETGGGAYGNTAWMIPEARLPNTGIRFRVPKFRLVMDASLVKEARGVMPDIYVAPTPKDIEKGIDVKIEAVRSLIEKGGTLPQSHDGGR
jgi:hypothetical protein